MDHASLVGGRQSRAQLPRDVGGFVFGEAADPAERGRQIFPVHVLHRQIQDAVGFTDVVDAADVRVRDLPRRAHLVVKLRETHRIVTKVLGQELQRDRLPEAHVIGAIDLAHPAAPEKADDAVARIEQRTRCETSVID